MANPILNSEYYVPGATQETSYAIIHQKGSPIFRPSSKGDNYKTLSFLDHTGALKHIRIVWDPITGFSSEDGASMGKSADNIIKLYRMFYGGTYKPVASQGGKRTKYKSRKQRKQRKQRKSKSKTCKH